MSFFLQYPGGIYKANFILEDKTVTLSELLKIADIPKLVVEELNVPKEFNLEKPIKNVGSIDTFDINQIIYNGKSIVYEIHLENGEQLTVTDKQESLRITETKMLWWPLSELSNKYEVYTLNNGKVEVTKIKRIIRVGLKPVWILKNNGYIILKKGTILKCQ